MCYKNTILSAISQIDNIDLLPTFAESLKEIHNSNDWINGLPNFSDSGVIELFYDITMTKALGYYIIGEKCGRKKFYTKFMAMIANVDGMELVGEWLFPLNATFGIKAIYDTSTFIEVFSGVWRHPINHFLIGLIE